MSCRHLASNLDGSFEINAPPSSVSLRGSDGRTDALWFTPILPVYIFILGPTIFRGMPSGVVWAVLAAVFAVDAGLIAFCIAKLRHHRRLVEKLVHEVDSSLAAYGYSVQPACLCSRMLRRLVDRDGPVTLVVTDLLDRSVGRQFDVQFTKVWRFVPADRGCEGPSSVHQLLDGPRAAET
jgi:hypothetical protein